MTDLRETLRDREAALEDAQAASFNATGERAGRLRARVAELHEEIESIEAELAAADHGERDDTREDA